MLNIIRLHISKNILIKNFLKKLIYYFKFVYFNSPFQIEPRTNSDKVFGVYKGFTGYYDKTVISPDGKSVVFHRTSELNCDIYINNLKTNQESLVSTTSSWNYQQGAMAEWIDNERIIFNNFSNGSLSAFIFNTKTKSTDQIKHYPVQTLLKNQNSYVSLNYNRLTELRPDYGFNRMSKAHKKLSISTDGLWKVNFSGSADLFVTLENLHEIESLDKSIRSKVNHVSSSKCGTKILFLFRYFKSNIKTSSLYLYDFSTLKLQKLMSGVISHYCWLDSDRYAIWYRTSRGGRLEIFRHDKPLTCTSSLNTEDGHPTVASDGSIWFDSYPSIFNYQKIRKISENLKFVECKLSVLNKPPKNIEERCDAHPKAVGPYLVIDQHQKDQREFVIYKNIN